MELVDHDGILWIMERRPPWRRRWGWRRGGGDRGDGRDHHDDDHDQEDGAVGKSAPALNVIQSMYFRSDDLFRSGGIRLRVCLICVNLQRRIF